MKKQYYVHDNNILFFGIKENKYFENLKVQWREVWGQVIAEIILSFYDISLLSNKDIQEILNVIENKRLTQTQLIAVLKENGFEETLSRL